MSLSTREKIIIEARELFFSEGLKNSHIDLLAQRAGVVKKTIYNHFQSKDEILREALRYDTGLWLEEARKISSEPSASFGEKAALLFDHAVKRLRNQGRLFEEEDETEKKETKRKVQGQFYDDWKDIISYLLKEGMDRGFIRREIDPVKSAWLIISMIRGVFDNLEESIIKRSQEQILTEAVGLMAGGILTEEGIFSIQNRAPFSREEER
jgi:AcrR family transcriptional regulator